MGKLSDSVIEDVMGRVFGARSLPVATNHRVVLSSTEPQEDGSGITEPVGNGYAPAVVDNDATTWATPSGRAASNGIVIAHPEVTDADDDLGWGDLGYFAVLDDDTDEFIGSGRLGGLVSPRLGDTPTWDIGELVLTGPGG